MKAEGTEAHQQPTPPNQTHNPTQTPRLTASPMETQVHI